jgi:hypothetical protein
LNNDGYSAVGVSADIGLNFFERLIRLLFKKNDSTWLSVNAAGPANDTVLLMHELGAIVRDIQNMGKHAVDKWQDRTILKEIDTIKKKSGYIENGRWIPYTNNTQPKEETNNESTEPVKDDDIYS